MTEYESLIFQIEKTKKRKGKNKNVHYNKLLKKRIVKFVEQVTSKEKVTQKALAESLGIIPQTLNYWVNKYGNKEYKKDNVESKKNETVTVTHFMPEVIPDDIEYVTTTTSGTIEDERLLKLEREVRTLKACALLLGPCLVVIASVIVEALL
jgi:transposase-like protein